MKRTHSLFRHAGILLFALLTGCQTTPTQADPNAGEAAVKRALDGKAVWEEKCRTVAGEKIYRKVEGVEGVLLMKLRPVAGEREWSDRNWPGAAFALESQLDEYITTFLSYEYPVRVGNRTIPITPTSRGRITTSRNPGDIPGYRWVEVINEKDGMRYRYTGRYDEPWKTDSSYSKTYVRFSLDKIPATSPPPRYGVTFEDHVIPEDRYLGIASSTVKVLDLKTSEVLGEMTQYVWSPAAPSRANPVPWLTAYKCLGNPNYSHAPTRQFVDKVLIPAKEK